jgi:hypothetical protein
MGRGINFFARSPGLFHCSKGGKLEKTRLLIKLTLFTVIAHFLLSFQAGNPKGQQNLSSDPTLTARMILLTRYKQQRTPVETRFRASVWEKPFESNFIKT